ncbi:hypothetical protein CH380_19090 [Leptospira adleri]|uniref:Uncharacterized protein n=1 Tax=Leptospira adleri TaxID=2023186 RepID=A0A2M9YJ43_9LEPT|nr:hypothetical protein CH380_19090 [Leptospira adleri]PJZ61934.1 hypothetical protein CH376_11080 [Leptospira adleri]
MELTNLYYIDPGIKKVVIFCILNFEICYYKQFYNLRRCSDSLLIYESRNYFEVKHYAENQDCILVGPFYKYGT